LKLKDGRKQAADDYPSASQLRWMKQYRKALAKEDEEGRDCVCS